MIVSYVSALKVMLIIYTLPHEYFEHPQVKYFIKSIKANRSLMVSKKNVMDIPTLVQFIECCSGISNSKTFFSQLFWLFLLFKFGQTLQSNNLTRQGILQVVRFGPFIPVLH